MIDALAIALAVLALGIFALIRRRGAGWVVALAMIAGTGTAIALSVKPQRTLSEERCIGLSCWPDQPATKRRPAQRAAHQPF
jgi:hypothetical protein